MEKIQAWFHKRTWYHEHKKEVTWAVIFAVVVGTPSAYYFAIEVEEWLHPPGTLYVYSVPQGALVYVAPEEAYPELGKKAGVTNISKELNPLEIKLEPGSYVVEIAVPLKRFNEVAVDGKIDFEFDNNFVQSNLDLTTTRPDGVVIENYRTYAKGYKVLIKKNEKNTLISLFQPKGVPYSELLNSSLLPENETFQFEYEEIKKDLLSNNAPPSDIPYMLKFLNKTGKIVWNAGEHRYVLEMSIIKDNGKITKKSISKWG